MHRLLPGICAVCFAIMAFATASGASVPTGKLGAARKLISDGKFREARAFIDENRAAGADDPQFKLLAAELLRLTGRTDEAIQEYLAASRLAPRDSEPLIALSELYLSNLQLDKSLACAKEAVAINPSSVIARLALANALLKTDQIAAADVQVKDLIASAPENPEVQLLLYRLNRKKGDFFGARRALEFVIARAEKKDPRWQIELADLRESEGDYADARRYLEKVIQEDPGMTDARYRLARLLEFRYHDYAASAVAYKEILRLSPQSGDALSGLERSKHKQRDIAFRIKSTLQQCFPSMRRGQRHL